MNQAIFLLRLSYWIAAIADFVVAILVWMPERMGVPEVVYPMGLASVIALIAVIRTLFSMDGSIEFGWILLVFPFVLIILMIYSYCNAGKYVTNT